MFKNLLLILAFLSCATHKEQFVNKNVCFLLFNIKTNRFEKIVNQKFCEERFAPNSTFKVPLAVMAFDSGILKDETSTLKWNGIKTPLESWNKDHTAKSWMQDSVVWFSQELTPKIGRAGIENYLSEFEYGNPDASGELKYFWLTPSPFIAENIKTSLKISAFEQVSFLKKLWRGELKATPESQLKTINLLTNETSPNQNRMLGKTGSGFVGAEFNLRIGWWVGFLETKQDQYIFVANFTDKQKLPERTFAGADAKAIAKQILSEMNL